MNNFENEKKNAVKEETIEKCRKAFNNMKVLDKSNNEEVDIFIECTSEAYIQTLIDNLSNEEYYISSKKLIFA